MMNRKNLPLWAMLALSAVIFSGCTDNGTGVFAGIESDTASVDAVIPKTASPVGVGADNSGNVYCAAGTKLYRKASGNSTFDTSTVTSPDPGAYIAGLGSDGTNLYLGTENGLWTSADGSSWTNLSSLDVTGVLTAGYTSSGAYQRRVLVETLSGSTYTLYSASGGSLGSAIFAGSTYITDATYDATNAYYWLASRTAIYQTTGVSSTVFTTYDPASISVSTLGSSYYDGIYTDGTTVYASYFDATATSATTGRLYYSSASSVSWAYNGAPTYSNLHGMVMIPSSWTYGAGILLTGSSSATSGKRGYCEGTSPTTPSSGGTTHPVSSISNYYTTVYKTNINRFYIVGTDLYAAAFGGATQVGGLYCLSGGTWSIQ